MLGTKRQMRWRGGCISVAECSHSIHKTTTQQQANRTRAGRVGNIYWEWDWWEEGVFP